MKQLLKNSSLAHEVIKTNLKYKKISSDGALKYRNSICQYQPNGSNGYTNPCLQASFDQISTISRPHSADVGAMNQSSSSSMHGRSNGFLSRGASSNVNGLYEDVDFQPTPRTLTKKKNIVWMRPHVSFHFFTKNNYRIMTIVIF